MIKNTYNNLPLYHFKILSEFPAIFHFVTTRNDGEGNDFGFHAPEKNTNLKKNLEKLSVAIGIDSERFIFLKQVHGIEILHIDNDKIPYTTHGKDALITQQKNICLCIKGADCVPLLFYDPVTGTIAAAHAGWRGTYSEIAGVVIDALISDYHVNTKNLVAGIGPSISVDHYEVDENLARQFNDKFNYSYVKKRYDKYFLDLWKCNKDQILKKGVSEDKIEVSGLCTYSHEGEFYSYRRDQAEPGRFITGVYLR